MSNIGLIAPDWNVCTETFIHAHAARLPSPVQVYYGREIEQLRDYETEAFLFPPSSLRRHLVGYITRKLKGYSWEELQDRQLASVMRQRRVAAVLAEYGPTGVAVMGACRCAHVPLIVHFHGYDAYRDDALSGCGRRYQAMFEAAAAIVAVSRDMQRQLVSLGAPEEKLHYNPYGVDTREFQGAHPALAGPTFLAVGRFVDKKGPLLTLFAFQRVLAVVPDARLIMIGDGYLLEAAKQVVAQLQIQAAVEFRGAVEHPEVRRTMQCTRAFVQHSVRAQDGDSEGTPVAILEASACGLPVVATRHAGIPDVVIDGQTGFLVNEGDVQGMADRMIHLAVNPELSASFGDAGRKRIETNFSIEQSINNLWKIIESAIKSQKAVVRARSEWKVPSTQAGTRQA